VARKKYSELKLIANFVKVSPGYLEATPELKPSTGVYSANTDITVTAVTGPKGSFFVTRKTDYRNAAPVLYTLKLPTSMGEIPIPRFGGALKMPGRDTRIHVTDYPVGEDVLVYCTAEIFTWQKYSNRTVLVLYGGIGEMHELSIKRSSTLSKAASEDVLTEEDGQLVYAQWQPNNMKEQWIQVGSLYIELKSRSSSRSYHASRLTLQPATPPTTAGSSTCLATPR